MKAWDFNSNNAEEIWDLYDKTGNKLPYTKKRKEQLTDDEYHLVVRTWIVNSENMILLSQRGVNKRGPLLWECTAGSALSGENSTLAINREVKEELGIDLSNDDGILMERVRRDSKHDFYEIWLYRKDISIDEIVIDHDEVIDVKWVSFSELISMMEKGMLMPTLTNFPDLYRKFVVND